MRPPIDLKTLRGSRLFCQPNWYTYGHGRVARGSGSFSGKNVLPVGLELSKDQLVGGAGRLVLVVDLLARHDGAALAVAGDADGFAVGETRDLCFFSNQKTFFFCAMRPHHNASIYPIGLVCLSIRPSGARLKAEEDR